MADQTSSKTDYTDSNSPYLWDLVYTCEFAWFCTHVLLIAFGVLSIIYWQNPSICDVLYRAAFSAGIIGLTVILYQKYSPAGATAVTVLSDDNAQRLVFSLFCLVTPRRLLALLPFIVNSLFVCLTYARSYILPAIGHRSESPLSTRLREFVFQYNEPLSMLTAYCELLLAVQLFFLAFTISMQGWAKLILYLTYFRMRYDSSIYVRRAVSQTDVAVDRLFGHPSIPTQVRQGWLQVKSLVRRGLSPISERKTQ